MAFANNPHFPFDVLGTSRPPLHSPSLPDSSASQSELMTSVDALRGEFRQLLRELHRKRIQQAMMTLGVTSTEELAIGIPGAVDMEEGAGGGGATGGNDDDDDDDDDVGKVDVHLHIVEMKQAEQEKQLAPHDGEGAKKCGEDGESPVVMTPVHSAKGKCPFSDLGYVRYSSLVLSCMSHV